MSNARTEPLNAKCDNHDQLRQYIGDFVAGYKSTRRIKTIKKLTPTKPDVLLAKEPSCFIQTRTINRRE